MLPGWTSHANTTGLFGGLGIGIGIGSLAESFAKITSPKESQGEPSRANEDARVEPMV